MGEVSNTHTISVLGENASIAKESHDWHNLPKKLRYLDIVLFFKRGEIPAIKMDGRRRFKKYE